MTTEQRLKELGLELPVPPEPFGAYVEAVREAALEHQGRDREMRAHLTQPGRQP